MRKTLIMRNSFLAQWMASGVNGETGNHAPRHVGLEHSCVCARALNLDQLLEGKTALVPVVNPGHAKEYLVQVNKSCNIKSFLTANMRYLIITKLKSSFHHGILQIKSLRTHDLSK